MRYVVASSDPPRIYVCASYDVAMGVSKKHAASRIMMDDGNVFLDFGGSLLGSWQPEVLILSDAVVRFWPHQLVAVIHALKTAEPQYGPLCFIGTAYFTIVLRRQDVREALDTIEERLNDYRAKEYVALSAYEHAIELLRSHRNVHVPPKRDPKSLN